MPLLPLELPEPVGNVIPTAPNAELTTPPPINPPTPQSNAPPNQENILFNIGFIVDPNPAFFLNCSLDCNPKHTNSACKYNLFTIKFSPKIN